MSLTSKTPADTYKDILEIDNSNNGVGSTSKAIKTGNGASTSLSVSDRALSVTSNTDNTSVFQVKDNSGDVKLNVDTTNDQVKALGHHINTQYATFGISHTLSNGFVINTHHPIPFSNMATDDSEDIVGFGTGTDPATSFTTADANTDRASDLACCMWYIPLHITIDSVMSIQGADAATGDTTRLHLFSYDLTSGSTSALSNGTLIAHTSSDITNAGSEQLYTQAFTIDSADVDKTKVLMCFFEQDSVNSDISYNVQVRYHFR